ncbi:sortase [Kribbella sp. NBC_01245]|uniref:class F sortase n=1 Tax=Kribbella sp. NBC_01245 TaxID=2903578 RepID=UPI002E2822E0|nr:sortase [Kribbella sp. NBC_01245]
MKHARPAAFIGGGLITVLGLVAVAIGGYLQFGQTTPSSKPGGVAGPSVESSRPVVSTPTPRTSTKPTPKPATKPTRTPSRTKATPAPRPAKPKKLLLPSLGITAPVVPIWMDGGSLTPPSNPRTVGWWSTGAMPGARQGSAVITGHTLHAGGGAFDDLEDLKPGDAVTVATTRGPIRYVVRTVVIYRKQALAKVAAKVMSQSVPGRLVLVTCEDWTGKVYLSNTVVTAVRVS